MELGSGAGRVLVVDDDLMSREVLAVLLEAEDFEVEQVASGEAALRHLRASSSSPDLVLTDLQMPGISGAAFARELRSTCAPGTVLIAMSGSGAKPETTASFDAFLLKPFAPGELLKALTHCRETRYVDTSKHPRLAGTETSSAAHASKGMMSTDPRSPGPVVPPVSPAISGELDERIYGQLRDAMPDGQLRQMYALCLDDVRKRIAKMRLLAAQRDTEQFLRQAHAIKGGCGMLGATELYAIAGDLESTGLSSAEEKRTEGVNALDELASACDRLERILGTRT